MKNIFICLLTVVSAAVYAQTPIVVSDSTQTSPKLDCLGDKPLFVLNNKILPCDSVRFIKPDDINEIHILRGASAGALYGFAGSKNGTVVITTKEYAVLQERSRNETEKEKP